MEETSGFYYNEDNNLLYGPNYVLNMDFELYKETYSEHEYPVHGWYWFNSRQDALNFWGIIEISEDEKNSAKESALAKLAKLDLTEEELAALLG